PRSRLHQRHGLQQGRLARLGPPPLARPAGAHVRAGPVHVVQRRARRAHRARARADDAPRLGALGRPRPDALARGARLGDAARGGGDGADQVPAARCDPRRADGRAAARSPRHATRRDPLMAAPLLELEGVSKAFGGLQVIDKLDLAVGEREIVSVIGPNGAGKTTVFNLITGVYRVDRGEIRLGGENLVGLSPHRITQRGVARTFQTLRLFLNMSVRENVMAAAYGHTRAGVVRSVLRTPGQRREEREIRRLAEERLAFFGERLMGYRWNQPAYSLSYANRRRLEIARATATRPRIMLLDAPADGLHPAET